MTADDLAILSSHVRLLRSDLDCIEALVRIAPGCAPQYRAVALQQVRDRAILIHGEADRLRDEAAAQERTLTELKEASAA